jgi:hypothetical protein
MTNFFSGFLVVTTQLFILLSYSDLSESLRLQIPGNCPVFSLCHNLLAFSDEQVNIFFDTHCQIA